MCFDVGNIFLLDGDGGLLGGKVIVDGVDGCLLVVELGSKVI